MLFWLIFVISFLSLVGGYIRDYVNNRKDILSVYLFGIGLIGLILSIPAYISNKNEVILLANKIDNSNPVKLKRQMDYLDVSKLNVFGLSISAQPPITISTPLSQLLTELLSVSNNPATLNISCSQKSIDSFNTAIKQNPDFPFTYYYLAVCQKKLGLFQWQTNLDKARNILEITTTISGHNQDHDFVLTLIKNKTY